jgi:hypothetical protein
LGWGGAGGEGGGFRVGGGGTLKRTKGWEICVGVYSIER